MKLIFAYNEDLKGLIEHARDNPCKVPYRDAEFPGGCLWLIKDEGVYLMSGARCGNPAEKGKDRQKVIYAEGFDPKKNRDVDGMAREACGGDDFIEALPLVTLDGMISKAGDALQALFVEMTEEALEMGTVVAVKSKPKSKPKLKLKAKKKALVFPKPKRKTRRSSSPSPF